LFSEDEGGFLVHAAFLDPKEATWGLGMAEVGAMSKSDLVFHVVKLLFATALEQLAPDSSDEEFDAQTGNSLRKLDVIEAEQRLLNYRRPRDLPLDVTSPRPGVLRYVCKTDLRRLFGSRMELEIQCHPAARCSRLLDRVLLAKDGLWLQASPSSPISEHV
jgi:hypothetical protein